MAEFLPHLINKGDQLEVVGPAVNIDQAGMFWIVYYACLCVPRKKEEEKMGKRIDNSRS